MKKMWGRFVAVVLAASMAMVPSSNVFGAESESFETAAESETVLETETDAESEAVLKTETDVESEAVLETETTAESETLLETENAAEMETVFETEPAVEAETVSETASDAETMPETEWRDEAARALAADADKNEPAAATSKYTYKVKPLLAAFNEYFYVETNNPDPLSFRFADKSSIYSDEAVISFDYDDFYESIYLYADVLYTDTQTARVNGGYIFQSTTTDGGELILQEAYESDWKDTSTKVSLPVLMDEVDYLIAAYANEDNYFDNMDSIQAGFHSICFYSGSFIRGVIIQIAPYWTLALAGHLDQSFYIYSPYARENDERLFASTIYPYRYDSLGFPNMMAKVSKRLDNSSSYRWDGYNHDTIHITYNGETRTYGGQGNIRGQGLDKENISVYFDFSNGELGLSFEEIRNLLIQYGEVEMEDDIPRENALSWEKICDEVGPSGSWVRFSCTNSMTNGSFDPGPPVYTFLYQNDDTGYFSESEWGVGYSNYWGGDLAYAQDSWIDGRYVDRYFIPGETFEDHPQSNIILQDVTIPLVSYYADYYYTGSYSDTPRYSITGISETNKTVKYIYDTSSEMWIIDDEVYDWNYADYSILSALANDGQLDEKYLDMVTITQDEIPDLQLDKNTEEDPLKGVIYDGTVPAGTTYDYTGRKDISKVTVSGLNKKYTFTGKSITPSVKVNDGTKELVLGTDYEIDYENNINAGTASINIRGIGRYYNTIVKKFTISPIDISKSTTISATSNKWNGEDSIFDFVMDNLIVKNNGTTLEIIKDYSFSDTDGNYYEENLNGIVTFTITGEKNYTGSIEGTCRVIAGSIYFTNIQPTPVMDHAFTFAYDKYNADYTAVTESPGICIMWSMDVLENKSLTYRIYRKTGTGTWTKLADMKGEAGSDFEYYDDTAVSWGQTYSYTVRVLSADGKSFLSDYDKKGLTITAYWDTPKLTSLNTLKDGITIHWSLEGGAPAYRVYRKTGTGSWTRIGDTIFSSYTDYTVKAGQQYTYTVRCITSDAKSFMSSFDAKGLSTVFVKPPVLTKAESAPGGVKVTWTAVAGAANYRVYRKTGSGSWTGLGNTTAVSYTDKTAKSGTKYTYTVRAISKDGKSLLSAYDTVGKTVTYIAAPVLNSVQAVNGGVQVKWTKPAGAVKCRVFRKSGSTGWIKVGDTASTTYTDKTTVSGTKYTYTVRCLSSDAKAYTSSYDTKGLSVTYVSTPVLSSAVNTANGVKITWKKPIGAVKFRVYRKSNGSAWQKVGDTTADSYVDSTVTKGTTFTYTVRCLSADGKEFQSYFNTTGKSVTVK